MKCLTISQIKLLQSDKFKLDCHESHCHRSLVEHERTSRLTLTLYFNCLLAHFTNAMVWVLIISDMDIGCVALVSVARRITENRMTVRLKLRQHAYCMFAAVPLPMPITKTTMAPSKSSKVIFVPTARHHRFSHREHVSTLFSLRSASFTFEV